jgi:hypothetical protein
MIDNDLEDKLKVVEGFLKQNPLGKQNPIYRHKVIEAKTHLLNSYTPKLFQECYKKLDSVDQMAKSVVKSQHDHSLLFNHELEKYRITSNLSHITSTPLTAEEASSSLTHFAQYSSTTALPATLATNCFSTYADILLHGVPSRNEVERNAKVLKKSLQSLVDVLDYERFSEVTLEELQSSVVNESWKNYFYRFLKYVDPQFVGARDIVTPTKDNYDEFMKVIDMYKIMNKQEIENLHEFDMIEN